MIEQEYFTDEEIAVIRANMKTNIAKAQEIVKARRSAWKCPITYPGCKGNCGSYGCRN